MPDKPKDAEFYGYDKGQKQEGAKQTGGYAYRYYLTSAGIGFPLLIILIGAVWLLRNLGYISSNISILPIVLIAIGIWMIFKRFITRP